MTRLALFDHDTLTDLSGVFSRWATEFVIQHRLPKVSNRIA
ncbi:hypothetical protein [Amycolatopsis echigonensis]|nr:hypothetical protein [Amycolatopsis echigonensis]